MRRIAILLLMPILLFATQVNESLLKIHATLFPKIVMMDYYFEQKLVDDTIRIVIFHEHDDFYHANRLKEMIETKYAKGMQNRAVQAVLCDYNAVASVVPAATAYYLFPAPDAKIEKAVELSSRKQCLSFSYDAEDLHHGVTISVKIADKVTPYINIRALKDDGITLRPMLLNIAELFPNRAVAHGSN